MKSTILILSILSLVFFIGCEQGGGGENKPTPTPTATPKPTPAAFSKPLETPCKDGKLIDSHAYSNCGPDGFWHIVQDDYYNCDAAVKAFRAAFHRQHSRHAPPWHRRGGTDDP